MLADDIADRIAIACPGELDGIIKDMWVDHTHGLLADNEMETLDEAARARREAFQERRQAARPGTSPPPWKRPTALGSQATAVARQAGLDRTAPPPRRIRPAAAAPGRPIHMGRDRGDAHRRRRMPGARVLHPAHRRHRGQVGRAPDHGPERPPGGAGQGAWPNRYHHSAGTPSPRPAESHQHHPHRLSRVAELASQGPIPVRHGGGFKMHGNQKIEHHRYRFISRGKASLGHSGRSLFLWRGTIGLPHSTQITAQQICRRRKRLSDGQARGRRSSEGRSHDARG
jgi:hypothetical protein